MSNWPKNSNDLTKTGRWLKGRGKHIKRFVIGGAILGTILYLFSTALLGAVIFTTLAFGVVSYAIGWILEKWNEPATR